MNVPLVVIRSSEKQAMSSLTCTRLTLCTLTAVIFQIIGLSIFVLGFFPVKPALSGISGTESFSPPESNLVNNQNATNLLPDELKKLYQELYQTPPSFDRLILMVIDGLPAEFLLGRDGRPPPKSFLEAMSYTQSLLASGAAIGYHAKAAPPTVTMPRLKAMLSGAIGGFLDVAFNFNTQALLDDNLIGQFFKIGWKMVMLGDETWLKLFPGLFTRHDGVSSFYVKDTVEVDHNVSRHLSDELNRSDWNALILHYLGLDHVGHVGGRSSALMGPKMKEMDEVIKMIHLNTIHSKENDPRRTLLMVVSDHGMTESGNHGGSSYEETDSLVLFVGLKQKSFYHHSVAHSTIDQVDITSTLALLFGVPIPKNNVGILISDAFDTLTDEQKLRMLELNSWQLFRLLKAQLPGLSCESFLSSSAAQLPEETICSGTDEDIFCCLYVKATAMRKVLMSKDVAGQNDKECAHTIASHVNFLRAASRWLSGRATYKPVGLLALGIAGMVLSCILILRLLILLHREVYPLQRHSVSDPNYIFEIWHLDETFVLAVIFILILSMGSSSMVEEEHYMWHFLTSTFFLVLLRKTSKSLNDGFTQRNFIQVYCIILNLISGRIMRGWHRGGVNWAHLPDISKWLEQSGKNYVKPLQMVAWFVIMSLSLYSLTLSRLRKYILAVFGLAFVIPGMIVLQHIIKSQDTAFAGLSYDATSMAQKIYSILGLLTICTAFVLPWLVPVFLPKLPSGREVGKRKQFLDDFRTNYLVIEFKETAYLLGVAYTLFWCLLQLVLQQPINAMPVSLLLVQILATVCFSANTSLQLKQWVEVAALYCLGMAGHFSLGNTNTLATIDVAGAFIGMSSHSMFLSGILMFMITYASPILALLGIIMYSSIQDTGGLANVSPAKIGDLLKATISFPCLVPLGLNSVFLVSYTIVLLLMRNHLFVWSVFSPKYVYAFTTTACVYIGVSVLSFTALYGASVISFRGRKLQLSSNH